MKTTNRKWELINPDKKREITEALIAFYRRERGEEIGVIAAEDLIDFMIEKLGKELYNKGVDEVARVLRERLETVWVDVEAIVKK